MHALTSLTGVQGTGKTRLAAHIAAKVLGKPKDQQLSSIDTPSGDVLWITSEPGGVRLTGEELDQAGILDDVKLIKLTSDMLADPEPLGDYALIIVDSWLTMHSYLNFLPRPERNVNSLVAAGALLEAFIGWTNDYEDSSLLVLNHKAVSTRNGRGRGVQDLDIASTDNWNLLLTKGRGTAREVRSDKRNEFAFQYNYPDEV